MGWEAESGVDMPFGEVRRDEPAPRPVVQKKIG